MKLLLIMGAFLGSAYGAADTIPPSTPYGLAMVDSEYQAVTLAWVGSGDDDREGMAAGYEVAYSLQPLDQAGSWQQGQTLSFELQSGPRDKLIKALLDIEDINLNGYLTVRAFDAAGNYSLPSHSITFQVVSPLSGPRFTDEVADAVVSGEHADGRTLLACVALVGRFQVPGVSYEGAEGCYITHQARRRAYNPFRYIQARPGVAWQESLPDSFPGKAMELGQYYATPVFSCRAREEDGSMVSGTLRKMTPTMRGSCTTGLGEYSGRFKSYDVLVETE
mgnify:CR=1 FL=1